MKNMKNRGQGAMEYLMTYGWAILVVMVVGVAMWRLGVFNIGTSTPPTANGFEMVKPVLATCEVKHAAWLCNPPWNNNWCYNGFTCQFFNLEGGAIILTNMDMRINDQTCNYEIIDTNPSYTQPSSSYLYKSCVGGCPATVLPTCQAGNPSSCATTQQLRIPRDSQFTANIIGFDPATGGGVGPCVNIIPGAAYNVKISITYQVNLAGIITTKTSTGVIRLTGT
jgi:hypothetical protein